MIRAFRSIGALEGCSFLVLLGIAMPMKYLFGQPLAVKVVGMAHGMLFLAYVALAMAISDRQNWPLKRLGQALVAAVLPFGTFVFDRHVFAGEKAPTA